MKEVIVAKFGGSSLADAEQFAKVRSIIEQSQAYRVVVPSAPGKSSRHPHKVTDLLLMCHQLSSHGLQFREVFTLVEARFLTIRDQLKLAYPIEDELEKIKTQIDNGADRDFIASRGEYLTGLLLAEYLGLSWLDAAEVIRFDRARKLDEAATRRLIAEKVADGRYVIPGFYGADEEGTIITFSRGGSDISGSLLAAALQADLYENWTDVSGFLIADPKIVDNPQPIRVVSFRELRELSYMGATVLHEEAVFPLREPGIPIHVKNTNYPQDEGTLIVSDESEVRQDKRIVTGIAGKKGFMVMRVEKTRMNESHGFLRKLISVFETNDLNVEHLPTGIDSVSVIVAQDKLLPKEKKIREEISIYCEPDRIVCAYNLSLIAVVGRGMISTKGVSARVFGALSEAGVNIRMITQGSSELSIIIGVEDVDFEKAIKTLYDAHYDS